MVTGYGPDIDPAALGHGVTAFVTLEIRQAGGHDPVAGRLAAIPEVLEAHTITGAGDMLCRVVARTNADLQRVIDAIVDVAGVVRAVHGDRAGHPLPYRVLPLVRAVAAATAPQATPTSHLSRRDAGAGEQPGASTQAWLGRGGRRGTSASSQARSRMTWSSSAGSAPRCGEHAAQADRGDGHGGPDPVPQRRVRPVEHVEQGEEPLAEQLAAVLAAAAIRWSTAAWFCCSMRNTSCARPTMWLYRRSRSARRVARPGLRPAPGDQLVELAAVVLDQAADDVFLGLEVVVQRGLGHAEPLGDLAQRRLS